ncbi:hypothetical protein BZA05DRAFT_391021 [Tricharina praecox]|uniref:uncharacterized protein n=1 Tax=Tricharina praecox TaxID=43433 RepID=UPI00221F4FFA|nr:uncharacterized protein BZA05DRAFT_391021 [Tricharina praecox]KAI5855253.1 hypothetical protein BZA05DRAFT_391021 [Tricharina praecox]
MRIRKPFALAFLTLCLIAAYLGFSSLHLPVNDKFLHFVTFLTLTVCFYWILDASRRRVVNLTMGVCTLVGGVGSEFVQSVATSREFDPLDIVSNLLGSGLGLLLCTWYHRRMLERKRLTKLYQPVSAEDDVEFENNGEELQDLEASAPARAFTATPPIPDETREGGSKVHALV